MMLVSLFNGGCCVGIGKLHGFFFLLLFFFFLCVGFPGPRCQLKATASSRPPL